MGIFDASLRVVVILRNLVRLLDDFHQALLVVRGMLLSVDTVVEAVSSHIHAYLDSQDHA